MRQAGVLRYGNPYPRGPGQPPDQSSRIATTRAGAAEPPTIRNGKHDTVNPVGREGGQVDQPLDLGVGQLGLVGGPEDSGLALRLGLLRLEVQRRVPPPGVDAHDPHAPLEQPVRRLGGDARPPRDVVELAVELVAARADEDDVVRPEVVARGRDRGLRLLGGHRIAVGLGRHVEDHARRMEPRQRELVDRLRALVADRRVVVPGRVDMGRVVRAEARELLERPPLPVAQQAAWAPRTWASTSRGPRRGPRNVDLGAQHLRDLRRAGLDRRGQVDEPHRRRSYGALPPASGHAAALGPGLGGRPARRGDPEHAHRLQAERELLATVAGADVEPAQLAHALEAVADGVAVREEALGGLGDVPVAVQEGSTV